MIIYCFRVFEIFVQIFRSQKQYGILIFTKQSQLRALYDLFNPLIYMYVSFTYILIRNNQHERVGYLRRSFCSSKAIRVWVSELWKKYGGLQICTSPRKVHGNGSEQLSNCKQKVNENFNYFFFNFLRSYIVSNYGDFYLLIYL